MKLLIGKQRKPPFEPVALFRLICRLFFNAPFLVCFNCDYRYQLLCNLTRLRIYFLKQYFEQLILGIVLNMYNNRAVICKITYPIAICCILYVDINIHFISRMFFAKNFLLSIHTDMCINLCRSYRTMP